MVTENEYYRDLRERSMIEVAIQDRVDDECEYKTVGPKSDTQQLADAQAENERLRGLLRQVSDGLTQPDEGEPWVYLGEDEDGEHAVCYSLMLLGWLAVVSEELGKSRGALAARHSPARVGAMGCARPGTTE